ncbi:SDR family NAD(P)-dependent oxidoreductase [Streptomyces sp. NPDC002092]
MRTRTGSATTPPAVGTDVSAHPTATTTTPANLRGQSTGFGVYAASKWAVEGLSEALAAEVAGQNIKVTLVEPGPYPTDWPGASAVNSEPDPLYDGVRQALADGLDLSDMGDPKAVGPALLAIVDTENPPLRVFFGRPPIQPAKDHYRTRRRGQFDGRGDLGEGAVPADAEAVDGAGGPALYVQELLVLRHRQVDDPLGHRRRRCGDADLVGEREPAVPVGAVTGDGLEEPKFLRAV